MLSIIIPTTKTEDHCRELINDIKKTVTLEYELIHTGFNVSAALNRNNGLERAKGETIIMLDDDITGFFHGWDNALISGIDFSNVKIVSARLKNIDGSYQDTIGDVKDYDSMLVQTKNNIIPSACIAFKKTPIRFNEAYKGAGFEDTSFCLRLTEKGGLVVINNSCKLIHKNEKKHDTFFAINREIFKNEFNLSHEECYKYH